MARKLGEVVATEKAARQRANRETGVIYKLVQKAVVFAGLSRTYKPIEDGGVQLPPEGNSVQERVEVMLGNFAAALTPALDLAATKDWANTNAHADVVVDGQTVLTGVPVSHLLFLEHQLQDIHTFTAALPVLDPAEHWTRNDQTGLWDSDAAETVRVERHENPVVLYPATKEHPAQVKLTTVEKPAGIWRIVKSSGALTAQRKGELLARVEKLQDAVKVAREQANQQEAPYQSVGAEIFSYLFR